MSNFCYRKSQLKQLCQFWISVWACLQLGSYFWRNDCTSPVSCMQLSIFYIQFCWESVEAVRPLLRVQTSIQPTWDLNFSAQIRGIQGCSQARAAHPKLKQAHLRSFLNLFFHEKANGSVPKALWATSVIVKANWSNFASFGSHFELVYNLGHKFWTTNCTSPIIREHLSNIHI